MHSGDKALLRIFQDICGHLVKNTDMLICDENQYLFQGKLLSYYTPGIYAEGYIIFVFPFARSSVRSFVRSSVRTSVTFVEFESKFCVKVSQVVYISATTYQKAKVHHTGDICRHIFSESRCPKLLIATC